VVKVNTQTAKRTALLVEDHALTRGLIKEALEKEGFLVTAADSSRKAIKEFDSVDPDVLITDIELGSRPNGVELATILQSQAPYLGIVFLTNYHSIDALESSLRPPQRASFIHKGSISSSKQLSEAVESVLNDAIDPLLIVDLPESHPIRALSASQISILRLLAEGWSNVEIAKRRGITVRSAERLISRTFHSLGVSDDSAINARVMATRIYTQAFGIPESNLLTKKR
jgi:DNA-binding NarL/FixJ family response regulator